MGTERVPPAVLFHGTTAAAAASILATGLNSGARRDVHLARDLETATSVDAPRGAPVVLAVHAAAAHAAAAHAAGIRFRVADNGVWLTGPVPAQFITR